jgi:hypothetical protein
VENDVVVGGFAPPYLVHIEQARPGNVKNDCPIENSWASCNSRVAALRAVCRHLCLHRDGKIKLVWILLFIGQGFGTTSCGD